MDLFLDQNSFFFYKRLNILGREWVATFKADDCKEETDDAADDECRSGGGSDKDVSVFGDNDEPDAVAAAAAEIEAEISKGQKALVPAEEKQDESPGSSKHTTFGDGACAITARPKDEAGDGWGWGVDH
jgi:hypothetical protein